jgi:hypothetical protein
MKYYFTKYPKRIAIISAIVLAVGIFEVFNLKVSLRYETDYTSIKLDEELSNSDRKRAINLMQERENEIHRTQAINWTFIAASSITLITSLYYWGKD